MRYRELQCAPRRELPGEQADPVAALKRIEIESSAWNGRKVIQQKLVIRATKMGYATNNVPVDKDALAELLSRLQSAPQPLTLEALGVKREWLQQTRVEVPGVCKNLLPQPGLDRFIGTFTDESTFLKAAGKYFERESNDFVILDDGAEFKAIFRKA